MTVLWLALIGFAWYSQRMPNVSAAKFLFDVMVKAAHEKRVSRSGTV